MASYLVPLAQKTSPQALAGGIFERLTEQDPVSEPKPLYADFLEIKGWDEVRRIERRVSALANKVGMHPEPQTHAGKNISVSWSPLSPFSRTKLLLPLANAISYAINNEEATERLGISTNKLTSLQDETDFRILEKLIARHFYFPKLFSKGACAFGGGLLLLTIASPEKILSAAATLGILSGSIIPVVLGIAITTLVVGLISYEIIRYASSLYITTQAARKLAEMPQRNIQNACTIGIAYLQAQKEKNKKIGKENWLATAFKTLVYTRSGDMRWYTHPEASLETRISVLRRLQHAQLR